MTGEQVVRNLHDARLSPWAAPVTGAPWMAGHHPVTPPRRGRCHHPYRRNRSPSRERPMANTATGPGLDGRSHRSRQRHAVVPSQLPANSWRLHADLRAVADRTSAQMPPDGTPGARTAVGARCAADHAHGPHGALPDPGTHHALNPARRGPRCRRVRARQIRGLLPAAVRVGGAVSKEVNKSLVAQLDI